MIQETDFGKLNKVKDLMGTRNSKLKIKRTRGEGVAEVLARMYPKQTIIAGKVLTEVIESACNLLGKGSITKVREYLELCGHAHQIKRGEWRVHQVKIPLVKTLDLPKEKGAPGSF